MPESVVVRVVIALIVLGGLFPSTARAQNATAPGTVSAPFPTLQAITLEWAIGGDADLDGVVTVRYRPAGETQWRDAMPLRRIPAGTNQGFAWANRHSGSIFDLAPATTYEIELSLLDPDGGQETRGLSVTTRAVPAPAGDSVLRPVTPGDFSGIAANAQPGDILAAQALGFGRAGGEIARVHGAQFRFLLGDLGVAEQVGLGLALNGDQTIGGHELGFEVR